MMRSGPILLAISLAVLVTGCSRTVSSLDSEYGKRRGSPGGRSVNGTAVLGRMFEEAGFRVNSARRIARGVDSADVVVWVPNDFDLPDTEHQKFFNTWLTEEEQRTVVYIGRDFDAAIDYWDFAFDTAQPADALKFRKQSARAKAGWHKSRQSDWLKTSSCPWFDWDFDRPTRAIRKVTGPWSEGLEQEELELTATAKLLLPGDAAHRSLQNKKAAQAKASDKKATTEVKSGSGTSDADEAESDDSTNDTEEAESDDSTGDTEESPVMAEESDEAAFEDSANEPSTDGDEDDESREGSGLDQLDVRPLLVSGDEVLAAEISRPYWDESRIIVITNGSWLLNMPLVNHEHRKLAGKLIEACHGRRVIFLESSANPYISEGDESHPFLHAFTVWPLNCILLHLTAVGILYCFAAFPIFGKARRIPEANQTDFGKHLAAFGLLLSKTGDAEHARQTLKTYRQHVHKEAIDEVVLAGANPFQVASASQDGNPFQRPNTDQDVVVADEPIATEEPSQ